MSILSKINLSSKDKRALVIGAVFVGAMFLFLVVISPKLEEISRLDKQIEAEQLDLEKVRNLRAALDDLGKRQDLAQKQLQLRKQESFSIASVIEGMAREAEIQENVQYLKPDQAKFSDQYREASVSLKVTEITPEQLVDFLYRIESSERLLRIRSLQIRNHSKSPGKLDATLKVFTLLPSQGSA